MSMSHKPCKRHFDHYDDCLVCQVECFSAEVDRLLDGINKALTYTGDDARSHLRDALAAAPERQKP